MSERRLVDLEEAKTRLEGMAHSGYEANNPCRCDYCRALEDAVRALSRLPSPPAWTEEKLAKAMAAAYLICHRWEELDPGTRADWRALARIALAGPKEEK